MHPYRDAKMRRRGISTERCIPTGCKDEEEGISTERCIPTGCKDEEEGISDSRGIHRDAARVGGVFFYQELKTSIFSTS
jgi:hypothetical protein